MMPLMARRIFVALPMSSAITQAVAEWRAEHGSLPVHWVDGKNLHMTIVPPWNEEDADRAADILRTIEGSIGGFNAKFTRVTYGPTQRKPRLIWASGESPDQLFILKHSAERTLGRVPETRPFRMHVTVARFRPEEFANFPVQKLSEEISWKESFSSFVLMESHLTPAGTTYEVLAEFPL
jgi:2'-5' RNA ligase